MNNTYEQMASDLYKIYEEQLISFLTKINKTISNLYFIEKESFDKVCSDIEKNMKEVERVYKQMDLEYTMSKDQNKSTQVENYTLSRSNSSNNKNKLNNSLKQYKQEISELNKLYQKEKERYNLKKNKDELIISIVEDQDSSNRHKLLEEKNSMSEVVLTERSNISLMNIKKTTFDIEQTAIVINKNLQSDNEKILDINNNLVSLNKELDYSKSIIRRIITRENKSKAVLTIFSCTLITVFFLILYTKI